MQDNSVFSPATREAGLQRLRDFQPNMGIAYAKMRNEDRGPGNHNAVSRLSPYIRRRLVTETEVIAAALAAHGPENAEKFVQEVLWRGYFKGWLERRPQVWANYVTGLNNDLKLLKSDADLQSKIIAAETGETGIDCFDAWAKELTGTGYLHNHARMWFASIWIFTLGLPWRLGCDFFFRHLLDGDPASNTCSWRWVAGLHTRGKPYEARAWNISRFTGGRFSPREEDFTSDIIGLMKEEPDGLPEVQPLRSVIAPQPDVPTAVILTEEDCSITKSDLASLDIRAAARLYASHLRSPMAVYAGVTDFETGALADTAARAGLETETLTALDPVNLANWADAAGARQIAMPYVPVGPLADWLAQAQPILKERGITVTEWRRDWDAQIWPYATAGFFKVKKRMPEILNAAGLT